MSAQDGGNPLPEYVALCPYCEGSGRVRHVYTAGCGGGYYESMGECSICTAPGEYTGFGYVYSATGKPIPRSVYNQIREAMTK